MFKIVGTRLTSTNTYDVVWRKGFGPQYRMSHCVCGGPTFFMAGTEKCCSCVLICVTTLLTRCWRVASHPPLLALVANRCRRSEHGLRVAPSFASSWFFSLGRWERRRFPLGWIPLENSNFPGRSAARLLISATPSVRSRDKDGHCDDRVYALKVGFTEDSKRDPCVLNNSIPEI